MAHHDGYKLIFTFLSFITSPFIIMLKWYYSLLLATNLAENTNKGCYFKVNFRKYDYVKPFNLKKN